MRLESQPSYLLCRAQRRIPQRLLCLAQVQLQLALLAAQLCLCRPGSCQLLLGSLQLPRQLVPVTLQHQVLLLALCGSR